MLDLEIIPERSLGNENWEFILGMHFSQAVCVIQSQIGVIKNVQVTYSDSNPLSNDIDINLAQDGIRLRFDPVTQRLKVIEIYNLRAVKLKYCGLTFNSAEVVPSIEQIEHSFGATHPGVYDQASQTYSLHFRGLSFMFPATLTQAEYYRGGNTVTPVTAPSVSTISLYSGCYDEQSLSAPALPLSCYLGQVYLESSLAVKANLPHHPIRVHLFTQGATRCLEPKKESLVREIQLGHSCQDIASQLGAPNRVFYKWEDKMKIHCPQSLRKTNSLRRSDYFFNYFTLGLDVLFDASTHRAKKFVLHTNYPGHYNFNIYHRSEFLINIPIPAKDGNDSSVLQITAYTKWDTISECLNHSQKPVVLNRASSVNSKNFFGATLCYGYNDFIFEVMPNQHIGSVTVYKSDL